MSHTKNLQSGQLYRAWRCFNKATHGKKKMTDEGVVGCDNFSINDRSLKTCMNYCLSIVQKEKDSLKKEILQDIADIQKESESEFDSKKLQGQIEILEEKKRKAIDLMLDGIISKEALKKQTDWYDEELDRLSKQLEKATQNINATVSYVNDMEKYIKALNNIIAIDSNSELLYREILDHIDIHKGKVIDVWLKDVPVGIQLKIKTSGKREYFKTEILSTSFIEK